MLARSRMPAAAHVRFSMCLFPMCVARSRHMVQPTHDSRRARYKMHLAQNDAPAVSREPRVRRLFERDRDFDQTFNWYAARKQDLQQVTRMFERACSWHYKRNPNRRPEKAIPTPKVWQAA